MRSAPEQVEILLVEDNPNDAELTLLALRENRLGNRVHLARDGAEALDFLLARGDQAGRQGAPPPHFVLLDLKLPKVDGLEVLRQMRAEPALRRVPVVVLTSSDDERDVVESYRLGVNSYIVKPVEFESFSRTVGELGLYWLLMNQAPY